MISSLLTTMNVVREVQKINEEELRRGIDGSSSASWHATYANSAWVYIGGLEIVLTEGDIVCVFSQWGEIEDISLIRDEATGRSKGFCFLKYEDARSAILAVDNMNGVQLLGKTLRVDHKLEYKRPEKKNKDGVVDEDSSIDSNISMLNSGVDVFGLIEREKGSKTTNILTSNTTGDIMASKSEDLLPRTAGVSAASLTSTSGTYPGNSKVSTTQAASVPLTRVIRDNTSSGPFGGRGGRGGGGSGGGVSDWRGRYAATANAARGRGGKS